MTIVTPNSINYMMVDNMPCFLVSRVYYKTLLETSVAGNYSFELLEDGIIRVILVGAGGAAAIKGVYDDRGYGWSGASGSLYEGDFALKAGVYNVKVASANNNTKGQGGNSSTLNPVDTTTHDTIITDIITVKGGGAGTTSGIGKGGGTAIFNIQPLKTYVDSNGMNGVYGSGGKGSSVPPVTCKGGPSLYKTYGQGQGCVSSEYASARKWITGNNGYAKIELISNKDNYTRYENVIV